MKTIWHGSYVQFEYENDMYKYTKHDQGITFLYISCIHSRLALLCYHAFIERIWKFEVTRLFSLKGRFKC